MVQLKPIRNPERTTVEQTRPPYTKSAFPYGVLYAAAALVLVDQASEFITGLAPYRWSSVEWRFGAFGLLVGRTTSLILFDALFVIAAGARGDWRALRVMAVLHAGLAAAVLAGLALFGLDFLEFKHQVPPQMLPSVYYATGRAAVISVLVALYGIVAAVGLFRATRPRGGRPNDAGGVVLVTGGHGRRHG